MLCCAALMSILVQSNMLWLEFNLFLQSRDDGDTNLFAVIDKIYA
jgi:hypothetical protein